MPPSETFATDILQNELDLRTVEFDRLSEELNSIRNCMAICTSLSLYSCMESSKGAIEKRRRELRGEMSALRQAITKLKRPD